MRAAYSCAVAVAAAALVAACGDASIGDSASVRTRQAPPPGVSVDRLEPHPGVGGDGSYVDVPFPKLSDYGLVSIESAKIVFAPGVIPYDVRNPLFTDYATKSRAVYVPPGTKVHYDATRPFTLPLGAIVVKSFGYGTRWIETRLLVQSRAGLRGYAYVWDADQREATLEPGGAVVTTESGSTHLVPNQNQCVKCHGDSTTVVPIGLKREQLDHDGQLARWTKLGILEGAPAASAPPVAAYGDPSSGTVADRARAYLDSNCAHCHNPTGSARNTGLFLGRDVEAPYVFGVCKAPVAAGRATGGLQFDIVPGAPDESILLHRLRATEPAVMMPEIGRSLVHEEGVALVSAWIAGLAGGCVSTP